MSQSSNRQQRQALKTYDHISQLPATMQQRTCTDVVCLVIGIAFTVILLIIASVSYNHQNYLKSNFPVDGDGNLCGWDFKQYQYLYFANLPEINQRICVKQCPKQGQKQQSCHPAGYTNCQIQTKSNFSAKFYQSKPLQARGGHFCWPTNQAFQKSINDKTNLQRRTSFFNSLDTIKYSIIIAAVASILYFILVQFLAAKITYITVILGSISLLAAAIAIFLYQTHHTVAKIIIGVVLIVLVIFFIFTVLKHRDSMALFSIYLKYSTVMCKNRILSVLYIIIFFILLAGFIGIMVWQFAGFWTAGKLIQNPKNQIYHELSGTFPIVMSIFMIIQGIWGFSFIKQAFNFCVSGNAVHWFLQQNKGNQHQRVKTNVFYPAFVMIAKHLGTVIAGAFMTGFFTLFDAIFDLLRPEHDHCFSFYIKCCTKVNFIFKDFFDFVRSDALAYVNLAGNPYCNSSRFCEMLCYKSRTTEYSQSTSRVYRLSAHFFIIGLVGFITLFMNGNISIYAQLLILVITGFIATLFISYHADSAQAIQISLLTIQGLYYHKIERNNSISHQDQNTEEHINAIREQLKKEGIRINLVDEVFNQRKEQIHKRKEKQAIKK